MTKTFLLFPRPYLAEEMTRIFELMLSLLLVLFLGRYLKSFRAFDWISAGKYMLTLSGYSFSVLSVFIFCYCLTKCFYAKSDWLDYRTKVYRQCRPFMRPLVTVKYRLFGKVVKKLSVEDRSREVMFK